MSTSILKREQTGQTTQTITREFFLGLDSDGCVFDTMEPKHRSIFVPALIQTWNLDSIGGIVEDVWCFVNLTSRERGLNRFRGLLRTFEQLKLHPVLRRFPEVLASILPDTLPLRAWIGSMETLSNDSLGRYIASCDDPAAREELELVLAWSTLSNQLSRQELDDAQPFASALAFMSQIGDDSEVLVISQSPRASLLQQWGNAGLSGHVGGIYGQEAGSKSQVLQEHKNDGATQRQRNPSHCLFVGDAPGDYEAAREAGMWFFPILAGKENASWERLIHEAWPKFLDETFDRSYQAQLVDEFLQNLPTLAPWDRDQKPASR